MDHFIQLTIVVLWNKQFFIVCMDFKLLACFTIATNTICSWKKGKSANPRKPWNLEAKPRLTLCDNLRVNNIWVWYYYPEWWQQLLQEPGKIAISDLDPCFRSKGIYAFLSYFKNWLCKCKAKNLDAEIHQLELCDCVKTKFPKHNLNLWAFISQMEECWDLMFYKSMANLLCNVIDLIKNCTFLVPLQIFWYSQMYGMSWLLFFFIHLGKIVMLVNKVERYFGLRGKYFLAHRR